VGVDNDLSYQNGLQPSTRVNWDFGFGVIGGGLEMTNTPASKVAYPQFIPSGLPMTFDGQLMMKRNFGSVSFCFKPAWKSEVGPGTSARLIELGSLSSRFNAPGTLLEVYSGASATPHISHPISWLANQWHHIVVTYSNGGVTLWIDGAQAATSAVGVDFVFAIPVGAMPQVFVGSDSSGGTLLAKGTFDELETYNYLLTSGEISAKYQSFITRNDDGDGWTNWAEGLNGTDPFEVDTDGDGIADHLDPYPLDRTNRDPGSDLEGAPILERLFSPPNANDP
jgi:hypothetical protein